MAPALTAQQQLDDLLDIEDVIGKRIINTRLHRNITIREENAITALEVMSRFAVNPKWLIYLPPTMSPCETSKRDGLLEHPEEAFAYYLHEGVHKVVCEQKHMGSRAVVVVCRDADAARKRFGIMEGEAGVCYTRTGRRFFNDAPLELEFLEKVRKAVEAAGIWEELKTDWVCLDCELMPWSAKAQELLRQQYAPTGAAARAALPAAIAALRAAAENPEIAALAEQYQQRKEAARSLCRGIPTILLDGAFSRRSETGPLPPARQRGCRSLRERSPVAHGDACANLSGRYWSTTRNTISSCGPHRQGRPGERNQMVGGHDGKRRRRHGCKAAGVCG